MGNTSVIHGLPTISVTPLMLAWMLKKGGLRCRLIRRASAAERRGSANIIHH